MGTAQQGGDGRRRPTEGRPHCCAAMAASRPPPLLVPSVPPSPLTVSPQGCWGGMMAAWRLSGEGVTRKPPEQSTVSTGSSKSTGTNAQHPARPLGGLPGLSAHTQHC